MSDTKPSNDPVDLLFPYTGYYAIDGRAGAFVMVDTNLLYAYYPGLPGHHGTTATTVEATITISMDGQSSTVYPFAGLCSFDGHNLIVRNPNRSIVATLSFYKDAARGLVSTLNGHYGATPITGRSPLAPIQLQEFASDYYEKNGQEPQLSIGQDLTVHYRQKKNGLLARVDRYYYNYLMFLLGFTAEDGPITFEMGTIAGNGLVAGNAAQGGALISIRNVQPPAAEA